MLLNTPAKSEASADWSRASRDIERLINAMVLLPMEHPTYALLDADLKDAVARRSDAGDRIAAADRAEIERRKAAAVAVAVAV